LLGAAAQFPLTCDIDNVWASVEVVSVYGEPSSAGVVTGTGVAEFQYIFRPDTHVIVVHVETLIEHDAASENLKFAVESI
jgi:hypothetical protein